MTAKTSALATNADITLGSASMCKCPERSMCEYRGCDQPAVGLAIYPIDWHTSRLTQTICRLHVEAIIAANKSKMFDRPAHADEYWRSSMMDSIRQSLIAEAFDNRKHAAPVAPRRRTPAPLPARFIARLNELTGRSR